MTGHLSRGRPSSGSSCEEHRASIATRDSRPKKVYARCVNLSSISNLLQILDLIYRVQTPEYACNSRRVYKISVLKTSEHSYGTRFQVFL